MRPPFSQNGGLITVDTRFGGYEYHSDDVPLGKRTVDLDQGWPLAKEHFFKKGEQVGGKLCVCV